MSFEGSNGVACRRRELNFFSGTSSRVMILMILAWSQSMLTELWILAKNHQPMVSHATKNQLVIFVWEMTTRSSAHALTPTGVMVPSSDFSFQSHPWHWWVYPRSGSKLLVLREDPEQIMVTPCWNALLLNVHQCALYFVCQTLTSVQSSICLIVERFPCRAEQGRFSHKQTLVRSILLT